MQLFAFVSLINNKDLQDNSNIIFFFQMNSEESHRALIHREEDVERELLAQDFSRTRTILRTMQRRGNSSQTEVRNNTRAPPATSQDEEQQRLRQAVEDASKIAIERQQRVLENAQRRTDEINSRRDRDAFRRRKKEMREQELRMAAAKTPVPQPTATFQLPPQQARSSSAMDALGDSDISNNNGPSLLKSKFSTSAPHRKIISQEELDEIARAQRKNQRDAINRRRLENIATLERQRQEEEQRQLRVRQEIEMLALSKEEKLLQQELEGRRFHYQMLDHIRSGNADKEQRDAQAKRDAQWAELSATRSPTRSQSSHGTADENRRANSLMQSLMEQQERHRHERRARQQEEERWQRQFNRTARAMEDEDRLKSHGELMNHLNVIRTKQVLSLEHRHDVERQRRAEIQLAFDKESQEAQQRLIAELNESKQHAADVKENERLRILRMREKQLERQREINARAVALKAEEARALEEAQKSSSMQAARSFAEAEEMHERRIRSVELARQKKAQEDDDRRLARSKLESQIKQADREFEEKVRNRRAVIQRDQTVQAANALLYRSMKEDESKRRIAENDAFYETKIAKHAATQRSAQKEVTQHQHANFRASTRQSLNASTSASNIPPHPELVGTEALGQGDVSDSIRDELRALQARERALGKR